MVALFMDLLVALTCGCLILFKIMLFVCAWVLTPQGNERSCNVHSTLVGEPKRDRLTCVATFASVNKFRLASVASLNFMDVHWTFANASWTFTTS